MADHDIGDVKTLFAVFRNEAGAQTAPTAVTLAILKPGATLSIAGTVVAADAADETRAEAATGETLTGVVGVYKSDLTLDTTGIWRYRWTGTGAVAEVGESWFAVRRRRVPAVV